MTQSSVAVWFEIPAADLPRAVRFYETVFGTTLKEEKFGPSTLALFPHAPEQASGCLISGEGYTPSQPGTITYLHLAEDLAEPLARIPTAGGAVLVPKTSLPSGGNFAQFRDSEGNRVGLFSLH
jgi:predicted enzyme related to lactoylglutathione lyase